MYLVECATQFALMASLTPIILRPTSLIPPKATFDSPGSGLATSTVTDKDYDLKKELLNDVSYLLCHTDYFSLLL